MPGDYPQVNCCHRRGGDSTAMHGAAGSLDPRAVGAFAAGHIGLAPAPPATSHDALRRVVLALTAETDVAGLLGIVLRSAAQAADAVSAEYWAHCPDRERVVRLTMMAVGDRIVETGALREIARDEAVDGFLVPLDVTGGEALSARTRPFIREPGAIPVDVAARIPVFTNETKVLNVPVILDGACIAGLVIRMRPDAPLPRETVELCRAFADQAALAVQITRMWTAARDAEVQAAIARERQDAIERQAARLAESNGRLRRLLAELAARPDQAAIVGTLMRAVCDAVGARWAEYWSHDREDETLFRVHAALVDGRAMDAEALRALHPSHPGLAGLRFPLASFDGQPPRRRSSAVVVDDWHRSWTASQTSWRPPPELSKGLDVPLNVGDDTIGALFLRLPADHPLPRDAVDLACAMADHAALALHLAETAQAAETRAADAAAARARAAALDDANGALSRTARRLDALGDLDAFFGAIAAEACALADAALCAVHVCDGETGDLRIRGIAVDGEQADPSDLDVPDAWRASLPVLVRSWNRLSSQEGWTTTDIEAPGQAAEMTPELVAWHRARGHRSVLRVPIRSRGATAGYVALCFREPIGHDDPRRHVCEPLALQAAVAYRLDALAEQSRAAAVLDERNRLAREIHDTLAQGFAAVLVNLQVVERERHALSARAAGTLDVLDRLARQNLLEARRSVRALRPPLLDEGRGLADALADLCADAARAGGVAVRLVRADAARSLPPKAESELLRIAQEALANALRHAAASHVFVSLEAHADGVVLSVADDGRGFDTAAASGFGLAGIRERADAVGAGVEIRSEPGRGTSVTVRWGLPGGPLQ
jgi:signal transduction histidine kinase